MPKSPLLVVMLAAGAGACFLRGNTDADEWTADFATDDTEFAATGTNPYFILEVGHTLELENGDDKLVITVTPDTKLVGNVETRVVEEREWEDGKLTEVSRNFFAISKRTNSVYYFGEDVDIYENDKVVRHEGAWLAGVNGAKFGLLMPGTPLIGGRHYQEIAPAVALDRAEIVGVSDTLTVPAGVMRNVLKVKETSGLEPGVEYKYYAPGIGLIREEALKLVRHGKR
jgi:hypothetical protein